MMFMNEWDIENAVRWFGPETPHLAQAAQTLQRLMGWANSHSDGWAYWPKPARAAKGLMTLLDDADRFDPVDVSDADLRKAYSPIKAMLTREDAVQADWTEVFG